MALALGFIVVLCAISFAIVILCIVGMWKAFEKAGQPGWACIIPIYNWYVILKIGGKPGWWLLLFLIPGVNIIFLIWALNMVSKSFGKDEGFTIGLVLFNFIFWPILGFSNAKYQGPYGDHTAFQAFQQQNKFDFENKQ